MAELGTAQVLNDVYDDKSQATAVVKVSDRGISIEILGYGSVNGANEVALIELANGVPQIVIWANREHEDPSHVITLEKAKI